MYNQFYAMNSVTERLKHNLELMFNHLPFKRECLCCDENKKTTYYHQRTCYSYYIHNYTRLCDSCKESNDDYWDYMWEQYYRGVL